MVKSKVKIGSCEIDIDRCCIIKDSERFPIEPKVMEVFACLWAMPNQVVSQQSIFEQVWSNAIFSPSSVQRSIAILRKMIEEDTKSPQFIITHPKRGYSLVLSQPPEVISELNIKYALASMALVSMIFVIGILGLNNDVQPVVFNQLRPLTSSESGEYSLTMSPSANIAAFVRIGSPMKNHIWLKNITTGAESKITNMPANYRKLGWAKDGNALAYITRTDAKDLLYYIVIDPHTLSAMEPVYLAEFPANSIESLQLQWSSTGDIYLVESAAETRTLLRQYSVSQNTISTLKTYQGQQELLAVALSPDESKLALAFDRHQNNYTIELMNLESLITEPIATINGGIRGLNWHPNGNSLLVSNREKLYQLFVNKKINNIAFDNFQYIRNAGYNFQGNEIMMELISLDVDILSSKRTAPNQYQTLVDTQSLDFLPIYSPQDDRFAFESHRNGTKQLFVYEQGKQRLIFSNPEDEELFGFVWSPNGQQIITASKDKLFAIDVDTAKYRHQLHEHGPFYLRKWYRNEEALLVSLVTEQGIKPAKFDLIHNQLEVLLDSAPDFKCAYMSLDDKDQMYFSDNMSIYTLGNQGQVEQVWQSRNGDIMGFTLVKDGLVVGIAHQQKFELLHVNHTKSGQVSLFNYHFDQGLHFTSTSTNADNYLFSRVKDIKKLVRLR